MAKLPTTLTTSVARILNFPRTATARATAGCVSVLVTELLRETSQFGKSRKAYQIAFLATQKIATFCLHDIHSVVRFPGLANATLANAFTKTLLQLGWFTMKSTQRISIASSLLIVALMSAGCASDCGCNSGTGLFGTNILQGQPIRRTVGSWFRGDSCDTCNTPAGQLSQPYAEACPTCVGGSGGQGFTGTQGFAGGQPLYGAPAVTGQSSGFSSQFAPQPGPAVGSTSNSLAPIDGSNTRNFGNFDSGNLGSLATPPSL